MLPTTRYPQNAPAIRGARVTLRPAHIDDRRLIFERLAHSDLSRTMSGPPMFPEEPVPTWEQFQQDYATHYFDDSAPFLGRCFVIAVEGDAVGQINYNNIAYRAGRGQTELDAWMRSEHDCGRGYGTDAIETLCRYLSGHFGVRTFMMQPSARNPRATRAYTKAGFQKRDRPPVSAGGWCGPSDYVDSVYMIKEVPGRSL